MFKIGTHLTLYTMTVVTGLVLLHLHESPQTQGEELAFVQSEVEVKNRNRVPFSLTLLKLLYLPKRCQSK